VGWAQRPSSTTLRQKHSRNAFACLHHALVEIVQVVIWAGPPTEAAGHNVRMCSRRSGCRRWCSRLWCHQDFSVLEEHTASIFRTEDERLSPARLCGPPRFRDKAAEAWSWPLPPPSIEVKNALASPTRALDAFTRPSSSPERALTYCRYEVLRPPFLSLVQTLNHVFMFYCGLKGMVQLFLYVKY
jgi:hypothetical protein